MTAEVVRLARVDGGRVCEVPIGDGQMAEAQRLYARMAELPSVRDGRRRVEIVPATGDAR